MSAPGTAPAADQAGPQEAPGDLVGSTAAGPAALRGSALRSAGYAATVLLSLISAPLLIRHLGISEFGRYTTVVALVTIMSGLTDAGLLNIALREWATRKGEDRQRLMRSLLGIRLELSLGAIALGTAFALLAGYETAMIIGTLLAGAGMLLQATANLLTVALQGELRFGWASIIDISRQALSVLLIVALVLAGAGLLPFFAVTIPAGLLALGLTAWLVHKRMSLRPSLRGAERWPLIRDTAPYAAAIALNMLYFRVSLIVTSLVASAQQTGYFATSFRVVEVLIGVPALAIGAAFPILSRAAGNDSNRFQYAAGRILELSLLVGTAVVLAVVLTAPFAIKVLAGAKGAPAVPVLQIQGLALLGAFVGTATGYALVSLRRNSALLISNGLALVANVLLTLLLVPIAAAQGAAIAAVIAETALALTQLVLLLRAIRLRLSVGTVVAVAVAGGTGALALLIPGLHSLLQAALGLVAYVAILALFGRLPPELRELRRRRGRHPDASR